MSGGVVSESDFERGNSTCCLHHGFTGKNSTFALLMSRSEDKEKGSCEAPPSPDDAETPVSISVM